jgi:hypothetical protein
LSEQVIKRRIATPNEETIGTPVVETVFEHHPYDVNVTLTEVKVLLGKENLSQKEKSLLVDFCYDNGYRPGSVVVAKTTRVLDQHHVETWGLISRLIRYQDATQKTWYPIEVLWLDGTYSLVNPNEIFLIQTALLYADALKQLTAQREYWK